MSKKKRKSDPIVQEEEPKRIKIDTLRSLCVKTGLSEFMLIVVLDLLAKGGNDPNLQILNIVCMNENIRVMNRENVEAARHELLQHKKSQTKTYTEDELRKSLVERREKELQQTQILIAGTTNQYEKLTPLQKDSALVNEFVGFARTAHDYFIYAYYVGPSIEKELQNPRHWLPVHKSHLSHFHKRLRADLKTYFQHTKYDQCRFKEHANPAYDPRYIAHKWLSSKEGKEFKPLLKQHRDLALQQTDFVVAHYEKPSTARALHYYDASKANTVISLDLTTPMENEGEFNVERDRLRQQAQGYRLTDEELCHVTIEEFPNLARIPLPKEIDFSFGDFIEVTERLYMDEESPRRDLKPPEFYEHDPLVSVKAVMMALNPDMVIKRTPALLADSQIQILESDNVVPILEQFARDETCREEIKRATQNQVLALKATELMVREPPQHIAQVLKERVTPQNAFILLED